ncbi:MAG: ligase-associated DNA damage response DEXH box helicase [Betaproteobacteria bacterium]|nr:ligase-associated DNA damage response DEXH box helicase [Betaproteobacteria bacterium]
MSDVRQRRATRPRRDDVGDTEPLDRLVRQWFVSRGWQPFPFQETVWSGMTAGRSGLLHATTGAGKTYAVWMGALRHVLATAGADPRGLAVLWLTPMRALAVDTARALEVPLGALELPWTVGVRTGDTSSGERARQARRLPETLVTTPESLSLLLSRADSREQLQRVRVVIVDEWHELMGNKRGVQTQLALARLRRWNPDLVVWGLSATLGNLDVAMEVLLGPGHAGLRVEGRVPKRVAVDTVIPASMERFPWAGHLGVRLLDRVVREIDGAATTLLFTNTRSQAELWYQALLDARPDWAGLIVLHHGSLDRSLRDWVEQGLKQGTLKACVCTSSLDLGVDFLPVERVLQVGSPKGVARLLQRAGRSGHAPGRTSRVTCVPSHAFELVEAAAARRAAEAGHIESRRPPEKPLDVLVQHLVTVALGGGFLPDAMRDEVRATHAYRALTDDEWQWALDFVIRGGSSLHAYPEYHRVVVDETGVHVVRDAGIARRHRMSVGTIVSDAAMEVRWLSGGRIGYVEESFIGRLDKGDCFLFAGRLLELVRVHEMTAYVRRGKAGKGAVPRWNGGKMPLSSELAHAVVDLVERAGREDYAEPELQALAPLFRLQARWSHIPAEDELLIEILKTREGHHFFCYPFAGRHANTGLASLLAWRIARTRPASFSICATDYGLELLCPEPIDWEGAMADGLFSDTKLEADVLDSLNFGQLARGRFREIARVAGLVFQGYPGQPKSTRQLQASSQLFYEVFEKYDPRNLLLLQSRREVLEQELEFTRLAITLREITAKRIRIVHASRPTPFSFPILVERIREKLSTEKVSDRVERMVADLERAAEREVGRRVGRGSGR